MHLSVREAATLLGQSPRTVRARLERGDLPGTKRDGHWRIERRDLPLTEAQRRTLQERAETLRRTVDEALPSRLARTPGTRSRSVADLDAFRHGAALLAAMGPPCGDEDPQVRRARRLVERGLLALAEAVHQYDGERKLEAVGRARADLSRAVGRLLLAAGSPPEEPLVGWVTTLETEVLPAVAGFARWADSLTERRRR